ncbi:MAG: FtsQ-type POTRA domain-containing protein [Clostridia bacterium]|nr:FtsQ-type POTRA domain-containing protein [Clostridia bacterium]
MENDRYGYDPALHSSGNTYPSGRIPARKSMEDMTEAEQLAKFGYTKSSRRTEGSAPRGQTGPQMNPVQEYSASWSGAAVPPMPPQEPAIPPAGYGQKYASGREQIWQQTGEQQPVEEQPMSQTSRYVLPNIGNPFDEPGEEPDLAKMRSDALKKKKGPFWKDMPASGKPKQEDKAAAKVIAAVLFALVFSAAILYFAVFRISSITVYGNQTISREQVIELAGIHPGDSIFRVDKKRAESNINANPYLTCRGIICDLPGQVTITVRENRQELAMSYCGIWYILDGNGVALESHSGLNAPEGLIQIGGLDIKPQHDITIGKTVPITSAAKISVLQEMMLELKVLDCVADIRSITLSDLDNILVETTDQYSVRLGNRQNIHAKLKSMLCTRAELNRMDVGTGTIDVSTPEKPTFIP